MRLRVLRASLMTLTVLCSLSPFSGAQDRDHDRNHNGLDDRWESRNGWQYRTYEGDHHPNGWHKGKKTEWRNCEDRDGDRHYNCYTYQYQGQPYYYYQDENGRMIVRRRDRDHDHDNDNDHDHGHK